MQHLVVKRSFACFRLKSMLQMYNMHAYMQIHVAQKQLSYVTHDWYQMLFSSYRLLLAHDVLARDVARGRSRMPCADGFEIKLYVKLTYQ